MALREKNGRHPGKLNDGSVLILLWYITSPTLHPVVAFFTVARVSIPTPSACALSILTLVQKLIRSLSYPYFSSLSALLYCRIATMRFLVALTTLGLAVLVSAASSATS